MSRRQWIIYWVGIVSILVFVQVLHFYNYFTQPSLGEFYTGKTVVYSALTFILSGLIFFGVNIYSLIICFRHKKLLLWILVFASSVAFLVASEFALSKISERFFPLDVWEQSTLNKIQSQRNEE